jgi:hypothetical protein
MPRPVISSPSVAPGRPHGPHARHHMHPVDSHPPSQGPGLSVKPGGRLSQDYCPVSGAALLTLVERPSQRFAIRGASKGGEEVNLKYLGLGVLVVLILGGIFLLSQLLRDFGRKAFAQKPAEEIKPPERK